MEGGKRCQWESSGKGRLRGVGEGRYREFNIGEVLLGKEGDREREGVSSTLERDTTYEGMRGR